MRVSVILLAGGIGSRMGTSIPKQFLPLNGKLMALYSYELFLKENIAEIIVVCDPAYQHYFKAERGIPLKFAVSGERRQDSLFNGFQQIDLNSEMVCIHDAARPLLNSETVKKILLEASLCGAAVAGMPMKSTVKMSRVGGFVERTLDRNLLWEIQTPQVMKREFLEEGFRIAKRDNLTVTDDASLIELLGKKIKLVEASYANIKITTSEDLRLAELLMEPLRVCS